MSLKEKFASFEEDFILKWAEYVKLNNELNLFRGKTINDENTNDINRLVRQIQETFIEMYPVFIFITERREFSNRAVADYHQFIDDIKKAGATEERINEAVA